MLEISGNLDDIQNGILNYEHFFTTVIEVHGRFIHYFGPEVMRKIPLLIDNGTSYSGYTPIITPVWNTGLIIKLHITNGLDKPKIIYQLAHELTHYVFYSLLGLGKPRADIEEESYCSAASLLLINEIAPDILPLWENHVGSLENQGYRKGLDVAREVEYDMNNLKKLILTKAEKTIDKYKIIK